MTSARGKGALLRFPARARATRAAARERLARGARVATIDIGSNSIHLLVAAVGPGGKVRVLDQAKERVGLGNLTLTTGSLDRRAMDAGIRVLATFRTLAERHGVTRIKSVATSAVREAANGGAFLRRIEKEVGLRVKVIPGREEARLIFLGVREAIDLGTEPAVIADLGGGSLELIRVEGGRAVELHSLKLGVARLAAEHLEEDPLSPRALRRLSARIRRALAPIVKKWRGLGIGRVVGTSGTLLDLAGVAGRQRPDPFEGPLNGLAVDAIEIRRLRRLVAGMTRADRARLPGLDRARLDHVVVGAIVADTLLRAVGAKQLVACTWALREGVLLDYIGRHRPGLAEVSTVADLRRRSVLRFARHLRQTGNHPRHVAALAARLFEQLHEPLGLPAESAELLDYAALLHDVGHVIDHPNHHRHTQYLITHGQLPGFSRDELEILGLISLYHRKGTPKGSHRAYRSLAKPSRVLVRGLSALLRIADGLDRSHFAVVRDVRIMRRGRRLTLRLRTDGADAALEIWETSRRANLLEKLLEVEVAFRVESDVH
jgi:exopolyphosphatase/guanosine-5'-triphosphate,3'-diphosphate pyrophosphatase